MGRRVKILEAVALSGLSEYALRTGIKQGRIPHIRTSGNTGKILIDIDLLERYLETQRAFASVLSIYNATETHSITAACGYRKGGN